MDKEIAVFGDYYMWYRGRSGKIMIAALLLALFIIIEAPEWCFAISAVVGLIEFINYIK